MNGDAMYPAASHAKKPNYLLWGGGCGCGCLTVVAIGVAIYFLVRSYSGSTPIAPVVPGANEAAYTNSREGLTGNRADHYVDFTLNYPKNWVLTANAPGSPNFVDLKLNKNGITLENFVIGTYFDSSPSGNYLAASKVLNDLLKTSSIPNIKKISESEIKFGSYTGYELLAEGKFPVEDGVSLIRMRTVALRNPAGGDGVLVMMLATNLNTEIKSAADMGKVGEMRVMVDSFRFK